MKRNGTAVERRIRVVGGVLLMTLEIAVPVPSWVEELAETIGLLSVVTGAVGYCPVKHLLAMPRG
ncbi:MAG: DUF2892 domain-containing protein [Nitrospira sp.]|nr:DUF2892 domain-containing protein [Nitrospira sp.]